MPDSSAPEPASATDEQAPLEPPSSAMESTAEGAPPPVSTDAPPKSAESYLPGTIHEAIEGGEQVVALLGYLSSWMSCCMLQRAPLIGEP